MNKIFLTFSLLLIVNVGAFAQMWNGTDTLYGNEWIRYNQSYYKISVAKDGIFRISRAAMLGVGIPANALQGTQYQLFRLGKEEPIFVSTNGVFSDVDYIEFVGQKNRTELDRFIFDNPATQLLNQQYSLFNDTMTYFLTWSATTVGNARFQNTPNDLNNVPAKEDFFWHTLEAENHDQHYKKGAQFGNQQLYSSHFDTGEGFHSGFAMLRTVELNPKFTYPAAGQSKLNIRLLGKTFNAPSTAISVNGTVVGQGNTAWGQILPFDLDVNTTNLTTTTVVKTEGGDHAYGNLSLTYPRQFNFDAESVFYFNVAASSNTKYLEIDNFSTATDPILYDQTNKLRLVATLANGKVRIALPPSVQKRSLVLRASNFLTTAATVSSAVNFTDFRNLKDKNYIILTSKEFFGQPETQDYAAYRQSATGGSYRVATVDVQELYDQFGYGVNRHVVGIRNFGHFVKKRWTAPHYLLIVGKGREYSTLRSDYGLSVAIEDNTFFVPTFGFPASDNLLFSSNKTSDPVLTIGRLAATTTAELKIYLDKIKEYDLAATAPQTIDGQAWKKRLVHLGGGGDGDGSGPQIKSYFGIMENNIKNGKFGGQIASFFKTSNDPIQISQTQQIFDIINKGSSIVSFFGHSGVGTWDFSVDDPESFSPKGRYPIILSMGCFSGNIHTGARGTSEKFLFIKDKGAIGFISSVSYGYIPATFTMANESYRLLGAEMYGSSFGDIVHRTVTTYEDNFITGLRELTQQQTFHGDPAIVIHYATAPDYITDMNSVVLSPSILNTQIDSFSLDFSVYNLGKSVVDSLLVEVLHELPNGFVTQLSRKKILAPTYSNNLQYRFAMPKNASGLNRFYIKLNGNSQITEAPQPTATANNELVMPDGSRGIAVFAIDNSARPVYPQEFSIVTEPSVILKASTLNTFATSQKYVFEIDTSEQFNSVAKIRYEVTQKGGILKWQPTGINYQNNVVYYWRVSPDSLSGIGFTWANSSFLYLNNSPKGWNQSHFYQLKKDKYTNLKLPDTDRKVRFIDDIKDIRIRNTIVTNQYDANVTVNSGLYGGNTGGQYVYLVVFDTVPGDVVVNPGTKFGSIDYGVSINFVYATDSPSNRKKLIDVLRDSIPNGYYAMLYTVQSSPSVSYYPEQWAADSLAFGTNLFQVLEQQGATKIRQTATAGSYPYIFAYRKNKGALGENLATSYVGDIFVNFPIVGVWDRGNIESVKIGPAKKWARLLWKGSSPAGNPQTDIYNVDLYGINAANQDVLLHQNIGIDTSLAHIDAAQYPYLKLKFNSQDNVFRTSANLDYWRVLYDGVPEVAVNPNAFFAFKSDTLQQGAPFQMDLAIENISDYNTDSLLVKYTLTDEQNHQQIISKRLKALPKNDTLIASLPLDTRNLSDRQRISVEVNPDNDQPELYHFNNYAFASFLVSRDKRNPLLDVTFDGQHLLEGDLVATKPNIVITLKDENKYLALADTSLFRVLVQYPNEYVQRPFAFDGNVMKFFPASSNNLSKENKATIELNPKFTKDGTYQLFVQARDASSNESGDLNYKISFEVVTKSSLSNVLNYPNPFTTKTHFVYTLTGEDVPEFFKIQILSISGKIVKEITQDEIGPLRVGTHRTDYAWNGTDDFGDKLANGVYLYRVVARKKDGTAYESFKNNADKFFENGFGKMVIMR